MDNQLDVLNETQPQARRGLSLGSIVLLLGIAAVAGAFALALARQSATQPTSGPAPDFTLTTFDGQPVHLADYRGKVVVLNIWATWCVPCRDEMPMLVELEKEYASRGVMFIAASLDDRQTRPQIAEFLSKYNVGFTV